jgi:ABC-type glycerol-3-phosphate transport system substrate-binding protein
MKRTLTALGAGLLLLAACGNDETDFQKTAAKTIVNEWKKQFSEDLKVVCDKPSSTAVGTKFDCTGEGPDGSNYTFEAEITKKDEVTVTQTG